MIYLRRMTTQKLVGSIFENGGLMSQIRKKRKLRHYNNQHMNTVDVSNLRFSIKIT